MRCRVRCSCTAAVVDVGLVGLPLGLGWERVALLCWYHLLLAVGRALAVNESELIYSVEVFCTDMLCTYTNMSYHCVG